MDIKNQLLGASTLIPFSCDQSPLSSWRHFRIRPNIPCSYCLALDTGISAWIQEIQPWIHEIQLWIWEIYGQTDKNNYGT